MTLSLRTIATFALLVAPCVALASGAENSCLEKTCPAGTKATTYAKKSEPFFACPTIDLAEYSNFVVGLVQMGAAFGSLPNISLVTGEPEYQGETKVLLDQMRKRANVSTFDEAVATCIKGKNGVKVLVANNPVDRSVLWVQADKTGEMFWMPKANLDVRR